MSWLSQGLQDIGLGGLNTFYNSAIKPVLDNPVADIGLGLGAAALTGGLLAPEIGGLFGAAGGADSLGGAAAAGAATDFGGAAAAAPTALSFDSVGGASGDLSTFLANPFSIPGGADNPSLALSSGFSGATPTAGLPSVGSPSLASAVSAAAPDWSVPSLGDIPTDFGQASSFAGAPTNAMPFAPTDTGLGGFEGNINTVANPSFSAPGANLSAPSNQSWLAQNFPAVSSALSMGKELSPLLGIGGLGYNLYQGYQQKQQLAQLQQQEQQQSQNAQQLSARLSRLRRRRSCLRATR
jgi:hypothetical protein